MDGSDDMPQDPNGDTDTDSDGIDDRIDPDDDNDGLNDQEEFLLGTNPKNLTVTVGSLIKMNWSKTIPTTLTLTGMV